jgi:Transcriptional Coactivator p15 (PC4)
MTEISAVGLNQYADPRLAFLARAVARFELVEGRRDGDWRSLRRPYRLSQCGCSREMVERWKLRFQANPQCLSIQTVDISGPLEFALNGREVIRAEVSAFNGRQIFNVRRWYRAQGGSIRPTPKGLACAICHLAAEAALLADTLARARSSGLTISVSK